MKSVLVVAMAFLVGLLSGCGSSGNGSNDGPVTITVSPTTVTLNQSAAQTFVATVTPSTTNQAVTWALTGTGCSGSTCGTISSTTANPIVYTAPATAPTPNVVTLTVTSVADASQSSPATITISNQAPVAILASPANATFVAGAGPENFTATVTPSNVDQTVTWALSGTGCSGSSCGTINSTTANPVQYTPPTTPVTPGPVTLVATANADPTKTAVVTITVLATQNALITGQYAYQLYGFTITGSPVGISGSFTADGNGNITGGDQDVNVNGNVTTSTSVTGTYSLGTDLQGTFTLTSIPGVPTFAFALHAQGQGGTVIEFDSSGNYAYGGLALQTSSAFSLGAIAGSYVFCLTANAVGPSRVAALGQVSFGPTGTISSGIADSYSTTGVNLSSATVTGSLNAPDSSGRGTAQITLGAANSYNLSYYIVGTSALYLLDIEPVSTGNPLFAGNAASQQPGLDNAALNSPSVFHVVGLSSSGIAEPSSDIGMFTGSSTTLAITGQLDANDAGLITSSSSVTGSFTSISTITGRGTIIFTDSTSGTTLLTAVFYLTQAGTGVMLENSVVSNEVRIGSIEPQTGSPFTNASLTGNFLAGEDSPSTSDISNVTGVVTVNNTAFTVSYSGSLSSTVLGNLSGVTASGTYAAISSTGRGTANIPSSPYGPADDVFYLISPSKWVMIGSDAGVFCTVAVLSQQ
jgi:hypothetical protein